VISDLSAQEALEFLVRDPQARAWLDAVPVASLASPSSP
jgi:hypothetical protein